MSKNVRTVVVSPTTEVLYSYQTPVAAKIDNVFVATDVLYSQTTARHILKWAGWNAKHVSQSFLNALVENS